MGAQEIITDLLGRATCWASVSMWSELLASAACCTSFQTDVTYMHLYVLVAWPHRVPTIKIMNNGSSAQCKDRKDMLQILFHDDNDKK